MRDEKIALFRGSGVGVERRIVQKMLFFLFFMGKCHDNKISKVQILLSRKFVVMAQAPIKRFMLCVRVCVCVCVCFFLVPSYASAFRLSFFNGFLSGSPTEKARASKPFQ